MVSKRKVGLFLAGIVLFAALGFMLYVMGAASYLGQNRSRGQAGTPTLGPEAQAYENLKAASESPLELTHVDGFPRGVIGNIPVEGETAVHRARNFMSEYEAFYQQSDPNLELHLMRTAGNHVSFYQTYKGIRVFGGEIVVMTGKGEVTATVGGLLPAELDLEITPGITPETALALVGEQTELEETEVIGRPRLVVFDPGLAGTNGQETRLAWQINIQGLRQEELVVDATTGDIILAYGREAEHSGPFDIDLEDANFTNAKETYCFVSPDTAEEIGSEEGVYSFAQGDPEAENAWNRGLWIWFYFHNVHGLHSYDNDGEPMDVYIRSTTDGTASYSSSCDLFQFNVGATVPDVYAHEFTHAIDEAHQQLKYYNQSGALDESYADVNGAMIEGNWLIGEGLMGGAIRDMSAPIIDHTSKFLAPSECVNPNDPTDNDNGCVHSNSGIQNFVAYLLSEGGTHPVSQVEVKPIGSGAVSWLFFQTETTALGSNAKFIDSRNAQVGIAQSAWGIQAACKVRNAWFAVGVGNGDKDCDGSEDQLDEDGDAKPWQIDNCPETYNPDQDDLDGDGLGDACDWDKNGNGVPDHVEELSQYALCPTPFKDCDTDDWDEDGIANDDDNCAYTSNEDQADVDSDGEGDACDPDSDGDGVSDNDDNCIGTPNTDQANSDGDGAGDACDPTPTCADVYAWTSGGLKFDGEEFVEAPPEPVTDPLACPPSVSVDEADWLTQEIDLDPDGESHRVEVTKEEGERVSLIPIPVCKPERQDESPSHLRQIVKINPDSGEVNARVANDLGLIVAKDREKGPLGLYPFVPRGGDQYHLVLDRTQDQGGDTLVFDLIVDCEPLEPPERMPPPDIGDPVPTLEPTASATLIALEVDFTAEPSAIIEGQCSTLEWLVVGADEVQLDGSYVDPAGQLEVCPQVTTTYELLAVGDEQEVEQMVTVEVLARPTSTVAPTEPPDPTATPRPTNTREVEPTDTPRVTPTPTDDTETRPTATPRGG